MARLTAKKPVKDDGKKKNGKPLGKKDDDEKDKKKKSDKGDDSDILAAERRADRKQAERDRRTGRRYLQQARNLNPQALALTKAIGEMKDRRKQDMRDIIRTRSLQMDMLVDSADELGAQYDVSAEINDKATAGALEAGMTNAVRERSETLSQLLTQGAGETDTMRAMLMAARNQNANAREANQSYWDTISSINQSITSLNEDTQSKLADAWISGEGEREQISRDWLESSSDAYTQLGLVRQAQADAYANAREYKVKPPRLGGKKKKKDKVPLFKAKGKGFLRPAKQEEDEAGPTAAGKQAQHEKDKEADIKASGTGFLKKEKKPKKGVPADKVRRRQSRQAFNKWAKKQDESYRQKRVPKWVQDYEGKAQFEGGQSNSNLAAALTVDPGQAPEGAKLRRWVG